MTIEYECLLLVTEKTFNSARLSKYLKMETFFTNKYESASYLALFTIKKMAFIMNSGTWKAGSIAQS